MVMAKRGMTLILALMSLMAFSPMLIAADSGNFDDGKKLAFDRKKGNCLACHLIAGGKLSGTIGPQLINMKERYPNKDDLRTQIWDASKLNPNTMMPPFGKHKILSDKELDLIVDFIHQL